MFQTSICPSSGDQVVYCCMWCSALGVVAVVLRSRCVVLCTVCEFVSDWKILPTELLLSHNALYVVTSNTECLFKTLM